MQLAHKYVVQARRACGEVADRLQAASVMKNYNDAHTRAASTGIVPFS